MLNQELSPFTHPSPILPNSENPSSREIPLCDCEFIEGLPASEAHERALSARALLGRAQRNLALWLIDINERKLYLEFSCSSVYQYGALHLNLDGHTVAEYLRTGHALRKLPLLSEAYKKGQISSSKVREITRVAVPETDAFWTESAQKRSTREIEKMVVFTPKGGMPLQDIRERQFSGNAALPKEGRSSTAAKCDEGDNNGMKGTSESEAAPEGDCKCEGIESFREVIESNGGGMERQGGKVICGEGAVERGIEEKSVKYHDKLIVDLSGEQMAVVKDAFDKARKDSGLKDRAFLLAFIARAFLEGTVGNAGKPSRPPYQIVLHYHPGSDITCCESVNGERLIDSIDLEKALCDAEIIEFPEPAQASGQDVAKGENRGPQSASQVGSCENPPPAGTGNVGSDENPPIAGTGRAGAEATLPGKQNLQQFINALYQEYKTGKRKSRSDQGHAKGKSHRSLSINTISPSLKKKVMLRDGGVCQAPGCGRRLFLIIHHIVPIGAGGKTIEGNLLLLCHSCHDLVHLGRLSVSGEAPSKLIWRDSEGKILN